MIQFSLIFVKFIELHQGFSIKIEVVNNDGFFYVIDIILLSILVKFFCFASINLTKMIKLHQFLKNWTNLRLKKLEDQLDIFERKNGPKD